MSAARDLLNELARHHVYIERHGGRLRMAASAPPPPELLQRVHALKTELLDSLPDGDARAVVKWRSPSWTPGTWAHALGAPGLTREQVADDVVRRWPDAEVAV